ncbi:MAG TPA: hypothetical protein P5075_12310 [Eubacteriales bacterium]|nr:hypothetical protein [Eubacteriales bacterium]
MNEWISKRRKLPDSYSIKREIYISLTVLLLGIITGVAAKATDSNSLIGQIGTDLSVWVLLATLIAAYSHHPINAAINTTVFFIALLAGYYVYGQLVLGFFPASYFWKWLITAFVSSVCGFVVWFSKSEGIAGAAITALPAGLILAWSYPAVYTHDPVLILGLVYAVLICAFLPRGWKMKCWGLIFAAGAAVIISALNLISLLPF